VAMLLSPPVECRGQFTFFRLRPAFRCRRLSAERK
jgi:hypothetical protein